MFTLFGIVDRDERTGAYRVLKNTTEANLLTGTRR